MNDYYPLDDKPAIDYVKNCPEVGDRFWADAVMSCTGVGDGNLNLVSIISNEKNASESVVVKQALPYLRCAGESWPLGRQRMEFESKALEIEGKICPGGFALGPTSGEEILAFDNPSEEELQRVLDHLHKSPEIDDAQLLEQTADNAFVRIQTSTSPDDGYCSEAVARNHGFRIGMEIQEGGVEQWKVGFFGRDGVSGCWRT